MKQLLLGILISFCITLTSAATSQNNDKNYHQLLNTLYQQDKELLITKDIVNIAQSVVNDRNQYSHNTVAKAFSILSDVAFNRGDLLAAFQFAQYGSEIYKIDVDIQLDILLKIARGYYAQGDYQALLETSQSAALLAEQANNMDYHLQALAYSVVAHALSADYSLAVKKLTKVEGLLSQNQQSVDQITLLEIIAEAHFYLSEYDNAVELLNRVLTLRAGMSRTQGIARTYHLLAKAYYQLKQYDNAYNIFWKSLHFAKQFKLNIRIAYAELGLGQVLYQQQQFTLAKERLLNAKSVFKQHNLLRFKLSTQIFLVKTFYALDKRDDGNSALLYAQSLANNITLSHEQIELYLLLTDYYIEQGQFEQALTTLKHYLNLYQGFYPNVSLKQTFAANASSASSKTKQLALNLAEESQLRLEFNDKYARQKMLINLLAIALSCGVVFMIYWSFNLHRQRLNRGYDEIELPKTHLAQPAQTKRWYQQQYKMARKYQYNISVVYLEVENWQELNFHFSKKILNDVIQAIAVIINENIDEEDYAGVISAGEYLLLCPHQTSEQVLIKSSRIQQEIKTRFFVNLGDHSVKIKCSVDSPNIQDIDPYVFLSRLSEATKKQR